MLSLKHFTAQESKIQSDKQVCLRLCSRRMWERAIVPRTAFAPVIILSFVFCQISSTKQPRTLRFVLISGEWREVINQPLVKDHWHGRQCPKHDFHFSSFHQVLWRKRTKAQGVKSFRGQLSLKPDFTITSLYSFPGNTPG